MPATDHNKKALDWLALHDPEYDWKGRDAASPGGDYVGAVFDNLGDFSVGNTDDDRHIVDEAIAIVRAAWRDRESERRT